MSQPFNGIYRNLNANGTTDRWSICNAHTYNGHVIRDTGVTHGNGFGLVDVLTTKPESIAKGCDRINRNGHREVVAIVGGTITNTMPAGAYIGRLTLNLQTKQFEVITNTGAIAFAPADSVLWFSDYAAVYTK